MVGRADKLKQDCLKAQAVNAHVTSFIALQTHIQGRRTHNHVPIFVQQHLVAWARVQEPELGHVGYWILHHVMRVTPHSAEKKNTVCISPDVRTSCHTYITDVVQNSIERVAFIQT